MLGLPVLYQFEFLLAEVGVFKQVYFATIIDLFYRVHRPRVEITVVGQNRHGASRSVAEDYLSLEWQVHKLESVGMHLAHNYALVVVEQEVDSILEVFDEPVDPRICSVDQDWVCLLAF